MPTMRTIPNHSAHNYALLRHVERNLTANACHTLRCELDMRNLQLPTDAFIKLLQRAILAATLYCAT
jgi:hypothetical protein